MTSTKIPILVGHRGWPARYPENTLEGFTAAVTADAHWLECDVQLSADSVPFVSHDMSLKRTAGLDRDITDLSAAKLDAVCVGERARFGERYAGVMLPRLSALIAWLETQPPIRLFVEIKRQSLRYHGTEPVVEKIMQAIQPALKQCAVISFDHNCLALARQQGAPAIGWAVEEIGNQARQQADALQPDYLFTDTALFTRVHAALFGSWQWISYHTEDATRALELATQGAAFVETNDIGGMLQSLGRVQP
ncbi:MAG: glycerophosphodiester phosphodiesterase family protein [Gammaproteobacteria bacterium]